jgi:RimJ/RimL family protein N-acetyltransferase
MSGSNVAADGHGPEWAAGVAELVHRAQDAFANASERGCLTVLDLEPWRLLDAWWLRRSLEPIAHLSGRTIRYAPCFGPARPPQGQTQEALAAPWAVGASPVELSWSPAQSAPWCKASEAAWTPDGPVIVLAGELPKRLPQPLLLAHKGQMHEWRGGRASAKWHPLALDGAGWVADSVQAYASALPSSMLSMPIGYWRFLERAIAWAGRGCIVLARAEGWCSLAQIRDDSAERPEIRSDSPPVNFHWIAEQAWRLQATAHTVHECRQDSVQVVISKLPRAAAMVAALCGRIADAPRSRSGDLAQALEALATSGQLSAALAILNRSAADPALLRAAWSPLACAAASASRAESVQLAAWLERVMADNPWFADDAQLLRGAGHIALACLRVDLARSALHALDEMGRSCAADVAALARCHEQLGALDAALAECDRALSCDPRQQEALATLERVARRIASRSVPWKMPYSSGESSLLMLDPLVPDHAPMLFRQMRDPSIASMTALPPLDQGDDGRAWIQARIDEGTHAYALIHRSLGFVGYLDLRVWQSTAFVCYWIGPDYQGRGFCALAIDLAFDLALRSGIDLLLSACYDDNVRSRRALHKCGFIPMDGVRALSPDDDRVFVMRPAVPMQVSEARQRLVDFCDNTASGLRFETADASMKGDANESD